MQLKLTRKNITCPSVEIIQAQHLNLVVNATVIPAIAALLKE
jgi:hypothetical protein